MSALVGWCRASPLSEQGLVFVSVPAGRCKVFPPQSVGVLSSCLHLLDGAELFPSVNRGLSSCPYLLEGAESSPSVNRGTIFVSALVGWCRASLLSEQGFVFVSVPAGRCKVFPPQ